MSMTAATSEHPEGFPHDQGAGGGGVPSPGPDSKASIHDGGQYPSTPAGYTEINGSGATYSAQRLGTTLLIRAQGMLPYLNEVADIRQAPLRISPPAFDFLIYKPQILAPALRKFDFVVRVGFPKEPQAVVIRDAQGSHQVAIAQFSPLKSVNALVESSNSGNDGFGMGDTLDEAIYTAISSIPPLQGTSNPDQMFLYKVTEFGRMVGGFAALNTFYARVTRQTD